MNDLTVFSNERFGRIRTVLIDGVIWFVGKDIAEALGYSNPRKALADHVDNEDKNTVTIRDGIPGNPNVTVINESGVYSLIFASKLPDAKEFKHWVTSEILPSVRTTGSYSTGVQIDTAKQQRAEAMLNNSRARVASLWLKISDMATPEYRQVCSSYASAALCGKEVIPLPTAVSEHLYTAEEIGKELGLSANKVGRMANELGMKTAQYGKYFYEKAKNCAKEVQTFKYNQLAVDTLRELVEQWEGGAAL
jgi:prophage antirepressor-like protein